MRLFTSLLLSGSLLTVVMAQTVTHTSVFPAAHVSAAQSTPQIAFLYQAKRVEHRGSGRRSFSNFSSQLG